MELEREENPQPSPLPSGAVDRQAKIKAFGILVGVFVFAVMAFWLLWPRHSSVIGPQRVAQKFPIQSVSGATVQPPPVALDMEKEKAYEEGKRDAAASFLGQLNNQNRQAQQPADTHPYFAPVARTQTVENPTQSAGFSDNMVSNGRFGLDRNIHQNASGLASNGVAASDPGSDTSGRGNNPVSEVAPNVLPEGTLVYTALVNELNGDNTGPFKVQVSNDVYFPGTRTVAIPQGSVLIGEAQKVGAQFQQRLAVSFHSLQIGNKQIKLDKMPGLDQQGAAAVADKTNNHYAQIFGASLAVGAIGGLSQIGNGNYGGLNGTDPSTSIRNGISQSTAQSSGQILQHFLQRMPTITIRPGTPVVVFLTGNVEIPQ